MRKKILSQALLAVVLLYGNNLTAQMCQLTCPANIVVSSEANRCGAVVFYRAPVGSPTCGIITSSPASGSFFPVGTTTVTATSTTGGRCTFTVTVVDRQAPAVANISATPNSLWPPNHKMRNVAVRYTPTDNCPGVSCRLAVTSDEPLNSTGDGNTDVDWIVVNANNVQLRAERKGNANGRVYTISIICTDRAGNTTTRTTTVTVAHDKGRNEQAPGNNLTEQALFKEFTVTPLQNPARSYFTLKIESGSTAKVDLKIFDLSGRVMESAKNINAGETIRVGSKLNPGIYILELRQGTEIQKLRLVKQ